MIFSHKLFLILFLNVLLIFESVICETNRTEQTLEETEITEQLITEASEPESDSTTDTESESSDTEPSEVLTEQEQTTTTDPELSETESVPSEGVLQKNETVSEVTEMSEQVTPETTEALPSTIITPIASTTTTTTMPAHSNDIKSKLADLTRVRNGAVQFMQNYIMTKINNSTQKGNNNTKVVGSLQTGSTNNSSGDQSSQWTQWLRSFFQNIPSSSTPTINGSKVANT